MGDWAPHTSACRYLKRVPHGVLGKQNPHHLPNAFLWCSIPSPGVVSITDGDKHVHALVFKVVKTYMDGTKVCV